MDGVRPRGKATKPSQTNGQKYLGKDDIKSNLNGVGHKGRLVKEEQRSSENIFLFYPNIIGMPLKLYPIYSKKRKIFLPTCRLHTYCSCHRLPLLYAFASENVFSLVQRLLSARCSRRLGRPILSAVHPLWRRP